MKKADEIARTADAFREVETANLRAWVQLSGGQKVDFFEEMIELAYLSGALRSERLALRDQFPRSPPPRRNRTGNDRQ